MKSYSIEPLLNQIKRTPKLFHKKDKMYRIVCHSWYMNYKLYTRHPIYTHCLLFLYTIRRKNGDNLERMDRIPLKYERLTSVRFGVSRLSTCLRRLIAPVRGPLSRWTLV